MGLSIALLGPFEVALGERPVTTFESVKVRALLAFLAVESGRPHNRAWLAGLLWPEAPEAAARTYLRHVLGNLKAALGDQSAQPRFLITTRDTVQLNTSSADRVDVATFTGLLAACDTHPHRKAVTCR